MQDHAYFAAIDEEMDNGGREALLHYLLNFDLTQVNLRVIPKTAALLDQQIESMDAGAGVVVRDADAGRAAVAAAGRRRGRVVLKDDLFETYVLHAKLRGISRRSIETKVGMFLGKQLGAKWRRAASVGSKQLLCYRCRH